MLIDDGEIIENCKKAPIASVAIFVHQDGSMRAKWFGVQMAIIGALELYLPYMKEQRKLIAIKKPRKKKVAK